MNKIVSKQASMNSTRKEYIKQLYILQGLSGVGHERALRLMQKFKSVEVVMLASCERLRTVEGIGAKFADSIRWAINEKIESYGAKTLFLI